MVPEKGFEPPHGCPQVILSHPCLPFHHSGATQADYTHRPSRQSTPDTQHPRGNDALEDEIRGREKAMSAPARPKLFIIDGYSLLFRAHLAYGSADTLRTRDGRPTGAVHGLTGMLLSILRERPQAVYVAWDAPGPTFRDEVFDEYKAHRPETDPDLRAQFGLARRMVEAFGVPSAEAPGFEADDLVGALAQLGADSGYDVVVYTGDSDQLQLVRDGVIVRMTGRGVSETKDYDAQAVVEKYGVRPEQFADFKALVGDPSDNIPGVPGVGKVTAARLLQQWGSLENLLEHVPDLPDKTVTDKKVRAALTDFADRARLALTLTTIRCDAPVDRPLRVYAPNADTWQEVRGLFAELEFRTLAQRLPTEAAPVTPGATEEAAQDQTETAPPVDLQWSSIDGADELSKAIAQIRATGRAALRLVTSGPDPLRSRWTGLAMATGASRAWYVAVRAPVPQRDLLSDASEAGDRFAASPAELASLLGAAGVAFVGHDIKPDLITLARHGVDPPAYALDTALAAYLMRPGSGNLDLGGVAERFVGRAPGAASDLAEQACREAAAVAELEPILADRVASDGLDDVLRRIELPLAPVLADMESVGVQVDRGWLKRLSDEMGQRIDDLTEQIYAIAGERFVIGSTQQLQRILFDKMQLPAGKRIKTGRTTSADHLETLAADHPIAQLVLDYREATKLKSTYADALPRLINASTGRLHTTLNQMVTSTGRLSSSDPNLQNIPVRSEEGRQIRRAFVAPQGKLLLSCDYSQIELRVFAHVTQDPEMMRAFAAGEDIHTATAMRLFGTPGGEVTSDMRRRAKTVNFAVIYGQSAFGLARTLGIGVDDARSFIASYFEQFPGVRVWTQGVLEEARARGYVETLMGRRRYLPDLRAGNRNVREAAERAAVNMPIQGTAADIMKLAMLAVWNDIGRKKRPWRLVLQVHDELVLEVNEDRIEEAAGVVSRLMEHAYALSVRLAVDAKAGPNWADMEAVAVQ